jgi:hypothetical protein
VESEKNVHGIQSKVGKNKKHSILDPKITKQETI